MRETFAVGRVDRKSRAVMWVGRRREPAFPGPWRVRAVVGPSAPPPDAVPTDRSPGEDPPPRPSPTVPASPPVAKPGRPQLDLFA